MFQRQKRSLIDLFARAHRVHIAPFEHIEDCLALQELLIRRISVAEREIRRSRSTIRNIKRDLGTRRDQPLSKDMASALKAEVTRQEMRIEHFNRLLLIYRAVGDAIAFTYIDRWDIKPMAFKESAGFITGKKGSRLERRALRMAFSVGGIAILNDLTTCLRHGDLTVIRPRQPGFLLMEIKSGSNRNRRTEAQSKALGELGGYLATDQGQNLFDQTGPFIRMASSKPMKDYIPELNSLIDQAHTHGTATAEVEKGLYYFVSVRAQTEALEKILGACRRPILAHINTRKFDTPAFYPFTLSIKDSNALFSYYYGQLNIITVLDETVLHQAFRRRGYRSKIDLASPRPISLWTITDPEETPATTIGEHLFNRIFLEFLSPKWLIREMTQQIDTGRNLIPDQFEAT